MKVWIHATVESSQSPPPMKGPGSHYTENPTYNGLYDRFTSFSTYVFIRQTEKQNILNRFYSTCRPNSKSNIYQKKDTTLFLAHHDTVTTPWMWSVWSGTLYDTSNIADKGLQKGQRAQSKCSSITLIRNSRVDILHISQSTQPLVTVQRRWHFI
jgi:hypothetical protein